MVNSQLDCLQYTKKLHRKYRQPNVMTGKKTTQNLSSSKLLGAPGPDSHLFIYRVENDTDITDVTKHLDGENIPYKSVECLSNPNDKFKFFKLTVGVSIFQKIFNYHIRLQGIRVRAFRATP